MLVLSKSSNRDFGLADLLFSYFLKEHDSEKCQYTLYRRRGHEHLIVELSTFDKMWKNDYFFISDDYLENREGEPQIPYAWQKAGKDLYILSNCYFTETQIFSFCRVRGAVEFTRFFRSHKEDFGDRAEIPFVQAPSYAKQLISFGIVAKAKYALS